MKQAILTLSAMCMFFALCAQLLNRGAYMRTVRMVLGLQAFLTLLAWMCEIAAMLN